MDEILNKLLNSELLNDETRKNLVDVFKKAVGEAKTAQEKALREEYSTRYEKDRVKIAETIDAFVKQQVQAEIEEFHASLAGLEKQRLDLATAKANIEEQAKKVIAERFRLYEAVLKGRFEKEMGEIYEEIKTHRRAVVQNISEIRAEAESDRVKFKEKAAKVLEHIVTEMAQGHFEKLVEDIKEAKKNDFGNRIAEAFLGEARRLFFNSTKELKAATDRINAMEAAHKTEVSGLKSKLAEASSKAQASEKSANALKESAQRNATMARLLNTIPAGPARNKMKALLEHAPTADLMQKTFKKFHGEVLVETRKAAPAARPAPSASSVELRTGGKTAIVESIDDSDIIELRKLAGMSR